MEILALAIIISAIFLGFFIGTIAGFGAAIIALPILLLVLPIQEAVAILSITYFIFSIYHISRNWKEINLKTIGKMALGIILGLVFGAYFLTHGSPEILKKILGVIILTYAIYYLFHVKSSKHFNHSFLFGFLGGTAAAMFSTSRPVYVSHLTSKFEKIGLIRANVIGVGAFTDLIRIPVMAVNGVYNSNILLITLVTLPAFILATWAGMKIVNKINDTHFRYGLCALLIISSITLIIG